MEFEDFLDAAANELEAAGIAYTPQLNTWLETLWLRGVVPHRVVQEYSHREVQQ
ncbi:MULTISPECIES: hypothetical protein [Burkholderia]|uniref:hypothetical protein n=1 Tax=Burkholderia TaxID=32008 RepID=UPI0005B6E3C9|nr:MULTISPECIES: hypothetical protein [Burkholderia]KIP17183.1 hypothetical protein KY49_6823 [Burkholderia sp. MSHR3999]